MIIWDWNGTLFDDASSAHGIFTELMKEQGLRERSVTEWRSLYQQPIQAMYEAVGFDFTVEPFSVLAERWYQRYTAAVQEAVLFDDAVESLQFFQSQGYEQLIISSLEENLLRVQVESQGIWDYFKAVSGHHDLSADSKVARAKEMMLLHHTASQEVIIIGDTSHDAEMAEALGAHCILVTRGYQDAERLKVHGFPITHSLVEARKIVMGISLGQE